MSDHTVWEVSQHLSGPIEHTKVCIVAHHGDKYDEMLVLDGNFGGFDQRKERAQEICDQLNGGRIDAAHVMRTKVQLATRLDEMIKALEFDGGPARSLLMSMRHDLFSTDETPYPVEDVVRSMGSPVTFEHVKQVLKDQWQLTSDELSLMELDTKFADIGFDSLDKVELIMVIEDEYGIELSDEDDDNITTPRELLEITKQIIQRGR
jgi:acyl carrier protein